MSARERERERERVREGDDDLFFRDPLTFLNTLTHTPWKKECVCVCEGESVCESGCVCGESVCMCEGESACVCEERECVGLEYVYIIMYKPVCEWRERDREKERDGDSENESVCEEEESVCMSESERESVSVCAWLESVGFVHIENFTHTHEFLRSDKRQGDVVLMGGLFCV